MLNRVCITDGFSISIVVTFPQEGGDEHVENHTIFR